MSPGIEERQRQQQIEQRIGGGGASDGEGAERRRGDSQGEQRGVLAEALTHEQPGRVAPADRSQRRGKAERPFGGPQRQIGEGLQPVDEDRFVEAVFAVEIGGEEVAALEHLARGLGEGALIDIEQGRGTESQQEGEQRQGQQQCDQPSLMAPLLDGRGHSRGPLIQACASSSGSRPRAR